MVRAKYSIVIPAYNAASHISKCLDSILNQNYRDFEVIIINDGSTDNTMDILNNYKKQYQNVTVISQDNLGPGAAREQGIKHASGSYIMFSDTDDYWKDNFLTEIDYYIEKWKPDILEFGYCRIDTKDIVLSTHPMKNLQFRSDSCIELYINQQHITNYLWNKVFSAKLFDKVIIPHLYAGEDAAVLLQLFDNAKYYVSISNIYYNYVMSKDSLCRAPFNQRKLDIVKSDDFMFKYLSQVRPDLQDKLAYAICARTAVLYCELIISHVSNKNQIGVTLIQRYKTYRSMIRNYFSASESFSIKRKGIVCLFKTSPSVCALIYSSIIKINQIVNAVTKAIRN